MTDALGRRRAPCHADTTNTTPKSTTSVFTLDNLLSSYSYNFQYVIYTDDFLADVPTRYPHFFFIMATELYIGWVQQGFVWPVNTCFYLAWHSKTLNEFQYSFAMWCFLKKRQVNTRTHFLICKTTCLTVSACCNIVLQTWLLMVGMCMMFKAFLLSTTTTFSNTTEFIFCLLYIIADYMNLT